MFYLSVLTEVLHPGAELELFAPRPPFPLSLKIKSVPPIWERLNDMGKINTYEEDQMCAIQRGLPSGQCPHPSFGHLWGGRQWSSPPASTDRHIRRPLPVPLRSASSQNCDRQNWTHPRAAASPFWKITIKMRLGGSQSGSEGRSQSGSEGKSHSGTRRGSYRNFIGKSLLCSWDEEEKETDHTHTLHCVVTRLITTIPDICTDIPDIYWYPRYITPVPHVFLQSW